MGWAGPVVRRAAAATLAIVDEQTVGAAASEPEIVRLAADLRTAVQRGAGDADLLILTQWLVDAASRSGLAPEVGSAHALRSLGHLSVEDGEVVYREPDLGVVADVAVDLAGLLAGGIAGNAAYELLKHAAGSFRRRVVTAGEVSARQPVTPLARSDALSVALSAVANEWPEYGPALGRFSVRQEQRTSDGRWRFVFACGRDVFVAYVPPGEPSLDRVELHRQGS
ncbi:hypothetical protein KZZ52_56900 [Dactylosporangium sp. AC04546]|uniref:hypothetical protein n=1 Tax=Dactylosporangium sp. AC04546 TaxID=2862460 RepID=UPI001EE13536|nr:hypothetical protein [Dactylosporangium sp. AC04546]WVK83291.1 hypothetical protein KZZ52_56900 [Dactylosporangium sp. AC04546]